VVSLFLRAKQFKKNEFWILELLKFKEIRSSFNMTGTPHQVTSHSRRPELKVAMLLEQGMATLQ
jgi:hypothetical protein